MTARKVSARARRFVEEYLVDHNGTQAIVRAGFTGKRPDVAAAKLLARPEVGELLERRLADKLRGAGVRADRVLSELAAVAFADLRRVFNDDGTVKPPSEWDDETAAAIAGLDVETLFEGRGDVRSSVGVLRKFRTVEKTRALELLGKHLRLWTDRTEISGPGGTPLAPPVINIGFGNGGPGGE